MRATSIAMCSLMHSIVIATALLCSTALADQPPPFPRIGVLTPIGEVSAEASLRRGLSELGYVEGRNLTIEWRRYGQSSDDTRSTVAELVRSRVDLIVSFGSAPARAVLSATSTIPLVYVSADPIAAGLAASLAHPGANATGVSSVGTDLIAKRLELLLQIAPHTRHVIQLVSPANPLYPGVVTETQRAVGRLHIHIDSWNAGTPEDLDAALRRLRRGAADALTLSPDYFFAVNKAKIIEAARRAKLPIVVPNKNYWGEGVLMSYGPSIEEAEHRAAAYVDKILRGTKPGDLPVEEISKYELVIDLRVARELSLKMPQDFVLRADEVIR